jgi:hypothetical protein
MVLSVDLTCPEGSVVMDSAVEIYPHSRYVVWVSTPPNMDYPPDRPPVIPCLTSPHVCIGNGYSLAVELVRVAFVGW